MAVDNRNARYDGSPAILAFADSAEGQESAAAAIHRAFGCITPVEPIDGAVARLDEAIRTNLVLVDARCEGGETLDRLLDRLDLAARHDRFASVVCIARSLIDRAVAHAPHQMVALLVDASEIEQSLALRYAASAADAPLPILSEEKSPPGLLQLSEEVGRIARTLAALSAAPEQRAYGLTDRQASIELPSAATVRAAIRGRRLREQFFDARLFADPAWDMLLDLMAARLEQRPVAVSSLCIAAAVPPTTALRWMKQLTDDGLFVRVADPRDGRRIFIELSDTAAAGLSAYFQALARMGVVLP